VAHAQKRHEATSCGTELTSQFKGLTQLRGVHLNCFLSNSVGDFRLQPPLHHGYICCLHAPVIPDLKVHKLPVQFHKLFLLAHSYLTVTKYVRATFNSHLAVRLHVKTRNSLNGSAWNSNLISFNSCRCHWGDPDVDGRIILRWIFRKWEGVVGTGWSRLRIGTGGGHLCVR
jgi:hypothetical protein